MTTYTVARVRVYDTWNEQEVTGLYVSRNDEETGAEMRGHYDLRQQADGGVESRGADWKFDDVCLGVAYIIECAMPSGPSGARELITDKSETTEKILAETPSFDTEQEMRSLLHEQLSKYRN